jgi:hypothetical protein
MVNKQYNVNKTKSYSPPPLRSHPVVSSQPNPVGALAADARESNVEYLSEEVDFNVQQNVYGRNIALYNRGGGDDQEMVNDKSLSYNQDDRLSVKDLTISDIGRFQYILQMDKEMVSLDALI